MKWSNLLTIMALILSLNGMAWAAMSFQGPPRVNYSEVTPGEVLLDFTVEIDSLIQLFNAPIDVTWDSPLTDDMHARVVMDSEGYSHCVFMQDILSGEQTQWEIWYIVVNPWGIKITGSFVSDVDAFNSTYPAIALDSNMDALIVWMDEKDGNWEIYYRKMRYNRVATIAPLGPIVPLSDLDGHNSGRFIDPYVEIDNPDTVAYIEHPDIVVDYEDNVRVVWSDERDGSWQVYYQKQTNDANPNVLIEDTRISPLHLNISSYDIDLGLLPPDANQGIEGSGPPHHDQWTSHAPLNPPDRQYSPPSPYQTVAHSPAIDVDSENRVHFVWQMRSRNLRAYEIYYEMRDSNGSIIHNDVRVTTPDGWNSASPDILVCPYNADNQVDIVWMDEREFDPGNYPDPVEPPPPHPGRFEIYTGAFREYSSNLLWEKRQSDMEDVWTPNGHWTGEPDSASMYPRISDGRTTCHYNSTEYTTKIVWHDKREGNWDIFFSDLYGGCHNPTPDIKISRWPDPDQPDMYPDIALHADCLGFPDIKYQHLDKNYGHWSIYDVKRHRLARVCVAIMASGQEEHYDLYPRYRYPPLPEDSVHTYGWSMTLLDTTTYNWYVEAADTSGVVIISDTLELILGKNRGSDEELGKTTKGGVIRIPEDFLLSANYPNPFNPQTTIRYALPEDARVSLVVCNVAGQEIERLVDKMQKAGYHECVWNGTDVASGIYFYRLKAGNFVETKKMVLLK